MQNRLRHFRAGLLLILSSALVFWIISYWFPLPDYLSAVSNKNYEDYQLTIQLFVATYLIFFLLNLIVAGLYFTKISSTIKFWMAAIPAGLVLLTPFLLAIPIATKFPQRNYFEIFMAMYRLFRFTKVELFVSVLIVTALVVSLNLLAAFVVRGAGELESVAVKYRNRYLVYAALASLVLVGSVGVNLYSSNVRALDRNSCYDYKNRELPEVDQQVPTFLNDVQLYGQQAGSKNLQAAFINFAMLSRQYYDLLNTDASESTIAQYQVGVAQSKQLVADICSEFATE